MSKYNELVTKLREIFQIDRPELDFGIYRILNARAGEINQYLEQRLPEKVKQALTAGTAAQQAQVAQELKDKEAQYQADGIDPATVPKVQELRQKLAQCGSVVGHGLAGCGRERVRRHGGCGACSGGVV